MNTGITSTIPLEIPLSAGIHPIDLNNLFVSSPDPKSHIYFAESEGLPQSVCSWIKGIYSVAIQEGIECVIPVVGGDCSNTIALAELLNRKGKKIIPFEYPLDRDKGKLENQFNMMIKSFNTSWQDVIDTYDLLANIRSLLHELDRLTYEDCLVTGYENHLFLVSSSDFKGDVRTFKITLAQFISECKRRRPIKDDIRIGYIGVPPIFTDLYQTIETLGGRVVFNEVQRQFAIPAFHMPIVDAYLHYTYPYGIKHRIEDIKFQIRLRKIDGIIHYVQNFCYRQLYDMIFKEELKVPILTLEGNEPGPLDKRSLLRLEGFIEILRASKKAWV